MRNLIFSMFLGSVPAMAAGQTKFAETPPQAATDEDRRPLPSPEAAQAGEPAPTSAPAAKAIDGRALLAEALKRHGAFRTLDLRARITFAQVGDEAAVRLRYRRQSNGDYKALLRTLAPKWQRGTSYLLEAKLGAVTDLWRFEPGSFRTRRLPPSMAEGHLFALLPLLSGLQERSLEEYRYSYDGEKDCGAKRSCMAITATSKAKRGDTIGVLLGAQNLIPYRFEIQSRENNSSTVIDLSDYKKMSRGSSTWLPRTIRITSRQGREMEWRIEDLAINIALPPAHFSLTSLAHLR